MTFGRDLEAAYELERDGDVGGGGGAPRPGPAPQLLNPEIDGGRPGPGWYHESGGGVDDVLPLHGLAWISDATSGADVVDRVS